MVIGHWSKRNNRKIASTTDTNNANDIDIDEYMNKENEHDLFCPRLTSWAEDLSPTG